MTMRTLIAAACLALLGGCQSLTLEPEPSGLVVRNVTLISPERAGPLDHAYVRILDGRIAQVSQEPLRGEQEIDGTGRRLIPGLIDSHVHLAVAPGFPSAMTARQAAAHPEIAAAALAQDPKSYLFHGFTTVVDLVGDTKRTAQWNALDRRPDAYFCGAAVSLAGKTRIVRYPRFSYDPAPDDRMPPLDDPAQGTPEAAVARIAAGGAICVKTIHEADMAPTVEEGRALVAAAHARNMPVLIHANRKRSQAYAVAIGVDVIAHGMWPGGDATFDDEARTVLAAIARDGVGYQPTTQVIAGELDLMDKDYLTRPELADVFPAPLIALYLREGGAATPDWMKALSAERVQRAIAWATEGTRILAQADANLIFGSDTPSDALYTNPPGLNGRMEMNHWIAAGVSEAKLFRALTLDNARRFHLDDRIGTIEPGKTANLILLRDNPLRSVAAYDTIETVFLHGRPIPRAELSARNAAR